MAVVPGKGDLVSGFPDVLSDVGGRLEARVCMWARRCADGELVWLSEGFRELTGRDPVEFLGSSDLTELVHPDDRGAFLDAPAELVDSTLLWRLVAVDGRERCVRSQVLATLELPHGSFWIGSMEDVSDEVAERHRRHRLDATFLELTLALNDADETEVDVALNNGLRLLGELVGADRSYIFRVHGQGLLSNTHEWCGVGVEPAIELLQSLSVDDMVFVMGRLGEGPQILDVAQLPPEAQTEQQVLEAQGIRSLVLVPTLLRGEVVGFVGFDSVNDVRTWSVAEVEVLERFSRAIQAAFARTEAQRHSREFLTELVSAREAAETATGAMGRLLSRVSHELRTPAAAAVTSSQLLLRSSLEAGQREHVERLLRSSTDQLDMIDDLLEIARSDHDGSGPPEMVDLGQFTAQLLASAVDGTDLSSDLVVLGDVELMINPVMARQILANLLSNAVKYNRPGGRVSVEVKGREAEVSVSVRDTGPGIDPEMLSRLWEPFERLGAESSDVPGTGLGMAIVAHALSELSGSAGVDSSPAGTVVTVRLPRYPGLGAHATPSVLIVDDHEAVREMTDSLLRQLGGFRDVRHAADGAGALAAVAADRPSVVLLDRHLPDLHGEALIAELRAIPGAEDLPVVLLSADATAAARERGLTAGADAYLVKPAPIAELVELLRSFAQP